MLSVAKIGAMFWGRLLAAGWACGVPRHKRNQPVPKRLPLRRSQPQPGNLLLVRRHSVQFLLKNAVCWLRFRQRLVGVFWLNGRTRRGLVCSR